MSDRTLPPQKKMTGMFGHPVAENPIDRMFDAVYAHYGLNWQFWKCDIRSADELPAAIRGAAALGFSGFCITVPYKIAAIPNLDDVDEDVRIIGAANYVTFDGGRMIGHNNDGKGVVKAIEKVTPIAGRRVAMLGAGGAGRAMAVEIARAGAAQMTLITRRESQGTEVADRVTRATGVPGAWMAWKGDVTIPEGTDILLNATHLGSAPELEPVPMDWSSIAPGTTVVDVITNPRITPLLETALGRGCKVVDGVEMLVQLAMQIFEAWTGIAPDEAVFQKAVAAALAE
ncbi:shikimate dehydrogenase family protein [Methylotetracoccus oryzae]|uniref:shikimate dehydrogenase family protein n=1 Tax=Methylotetracoccus oryzae TaxID=1919059 RepID=UPI0019135C17|nr:shikimate dehydrogenase [Methylotetracoccus oryzae]